VLRSFHKLHNIGGRAASLAVFAVFASAHQRLTSPPSAEFLGPRSFGDLKNSEMVAVLPLFFAVFWLFAVFAATMVTVESGHYGESVSAGRRYRTLRIPE
jgi:hypothetical protein